MQIHHVIVKPFEQFIVDPVMGLVKQRADKIQQADDHRIVLNGEQYDAVDGTFDVPDHVAQHFLRQPGWHAGPNPYTPVPAVEAPVPPVPLAPDAAKSDPNGGKDDKASGK